MFTIRKDVNELKSEIRQLKKQLALAEDERAKFQKLAERDFLTGLYNRHGFIREAERFLLEMKAEPPKNAKRRTPIISKMSVLFVDVDDLKKMNDRFGHADGDRYIRAIGKVLAKSVRTIDVVGRWGGDEFAIALINAGDAEASIVAQKLAHAIGKIKLGKKFADFTCSASIGLISMEGVNPKHIGYDLHALIEHADKAMYAAKKEKGRGMIVSIPFGM